MYGALQRHPILAPPHTHTVHMQHLDLSYCARLEHNALLYVAESAALRSGCLRHIGAAGLGCNATRGTGDMLAALAAGARDRGGQPGYGGLWCMMMMLYCYALLYIMLCSLLLLFHLYLVPCT